MPIPLKIHLTAGQVHNRKGGFVVVCRGASLRSVQALRFFTCFRNPFTKLRCPPNFHTPQMLKYHYHTTSLMSVTHLRSFTKKNNLIRSKFTGPTNTIPERIDSSARHRSNEIQLCMGAGEESDARASSRGCEVAARYAITLSNI